LSYRRGEIVQGGKCPEGNLSVPPLFEVSLSMFHVSLCLSGVSLSVSAYNALLALTNGYGSCLKIMFVQTFRSVLCSLGKYWGF